MHKLSFGLTIFYVLYPTYNHIHFRGMCCGYGHSWTSLVQTHYCFNSHSQNLCRAVKQEGLGSAGHFFLSYNLALEQ